VTPDIPFDADASMFKAAMEKLTKIGDIDVTQTGPSLLGGYTWTVSFLETKSLLNRGDVPDLAIISSLGGGSGYVPRITVDELRKGTSKEVQRISVLAGGASVDPSSAFRLSFMGESTNLIPVPVYNDSSCIGSTPAKQIITSTTEDTSDMGGDSTVSSRTSFSLSYRGEKTSMIKANDITCSETARSIEKELEMLPLLYDVDVSGSKSNQNDAGCIWIVTFVSVTGNPELLKGTGLHLLKM